METLDERVAHLEGRVKEQSRGFAELQGSVGHVSGRIDALDQKVDRLFGALGARIDALDQKVDRLFGALDSKLSRQFVWTVGIQVAVLLTVMGALVAALTTGPSR